MAIRTREFIFLILPFFVFLSGVGCVSAKKVSFDMQRIALQPMVEKALGELEFAYESRSLKDFTQLLDKDFVDRGRFQPVLESYFSSVTSPHIHFVIDMVVADKNGVNVRLHWFKRAVTGSNVVIESEGQSQFLFKRYPDKILKLKRIIKENPFF